MGTALIACGIILIAARVNGAATAGTIVGWWPLFLVMLGGEVLWHNYAVKDGSIRLNFDVFSILTVGLIVFFSLGMFALTEIGVVARLNRIVSAQDYYLETPVRAATVDGSIRKVVLSSPYCRLSVRTAGEKDIAAYGTGIVTAASLKAAKEMLNNAEVNFRQEGDTIYVSFHYPRTGSGLGYDVRVDEFTVTVPGDLAMEVNDTASLRVYADEVKANWLIDGAGDAEIRLPQDADVLIEAHTVDAKLLGGNAEWKITEEQNAAEGVYGRIKGEAQCGNGKYKYIVLGTERLTVNMLK